MEDGGYTTFSMPEYYGLAIRQKYTGRPFVTFNDQPVAVRMVTTLPILRFYNVYPVYLPSRLEAIVGEPQNSAKRPDIILVCLLIVKG